MNGISIVIPVYNEAASIASVIRQIQDVLQRRGIAFDIIVVDDGSTDGTVDQAACVDGVTVLRHAVNLGYGAALKTGIRHSRHDLICITDGDETYPNDRIPDLIAVLTQQAVDMVVGARTKSAIPRIRRPAKWFLAKLAHLVSAQEIPDLNSGLRVFKRPSAFRFFGLLPDGFSFTTTITLAMLANNCQVRYIPVNYYTRTGKSKIRPIRDTGNFIQLILRIALYFAPLKIFLPFSGLLIFAAVVWGTYSWLILGTLADVTTIVIAMAGVQVAMIGLLAELINSRLANPYQEGPGENVEKRPPN